MTQPWSGFRSTVVLPKSRVTKHGVNETGSKPLSIQEP